MAYLPADDIHNFGKCGIEREQPMINGTSQRLAVSLAGLKRLEAQIQRTMANAGGVNPSLEKENIRRKAAYMKQQVSEAIDKTQAALSTDHLDISA